MNVRLYQIFDEVSGCVIGGIVRERADEAARRSFAGVLGDKESQIGLHAQDYSLLFLGEQDDTTGLITSVVPDVVYTGRQFVREKEAERVAQS